MVVQAGDVAEALSAGMQKGFAGFLVDLLEGFQAVGREARADEVHRLAATLGQRDQAGLGVGLQPLGLAEAALEADQPFVLAQAQRFGQQPAGFQAFAVVGVAQVQGALGHAMKAHHQLLAAPLALPVFTHRLGQRSDVAGVVVVAVDEAQLGQVAGLQRPAGDVVDDAGCGGARVLRIGRQHEHTADALLLERIERRGDRRLAIAHGRRHAHPQPAFAEAALQQLGLGFRPDLQRRAVLRPDGGVLGGRLGRPYAQDDAVQDDEPDQLGNLDHPRVGQELREVFAQRRGGGRLGSAEVAQQHGDVGGQRAGRGGAVALRRFGLKGRHRVGKGSAPRARAAEGLGLGVGEMQHLEAHAGRLLLAGRAAQADGAAAVQRAVATLEAEQFARVAKAHISPVV
mmetsp:Transcript_11282/g.21799  ORF Transcript_11282/g.21799 Transcript_11282/m.21799 type:complete len:400 (-) Transcript_11282:395-1594(-)